MIAQILSRLIAFFLILFMGVSVVQADDNKSVEEAKNLLEEKKIQFLLDQIGDSGAEFFRNGEKHDAKKAKEHLARKLKMAQGRFWFWSSETKVTVENFIEKIASRSSTTGETYYIKVGKSKKQETGQWLRRELKKYKGPKSRATATIKNPD